MIIITIIILLMLGDDELHCPKCRIITHLDPGGVRFLPINYALKEVAEALEDDISPPASLGHPSRQISGMDSESRLGVFVASCHMSLFVHWTILVYTSPSAGAIGQLMCTHTSLCCFLYSCSAL